MDISIKDLVKGTTAKFVCYRDGELWYRVDHAHRPMPQIWNIEQGLPDEVSTVKRIVFEFPVPISDTGTGIFPAEVKAITLMRWIRKQLERVEKGEFKFSSGNLGDIR